ncbi:ribosomal protein L15 [Pisolithus croceorrhizus]|nr:ribosomal protein L15 [Pisolithus croceorrhizus]KAI6167205.1 ribosomal protein L15 [Pisolithus thermaeus]
MSSVVRAGASRVSLSNLRPALGSLHDKKRVGRGQGSGYGGTSGRGHKGAKARSGNGKPKAGFEGGQTPITKRFPKKGFVNPNRKTYAAVNLDRIQHWIEQGRLTSSSDQPITAKDLLLSGCVHNVHDGVKLLGDGAQFLKSAIHIVPSRASKSAIKAVEANGGTVFCQYYNPLALRDCVKGRTDRVAAAPTRRNDILWYTDWKNRGYLSPEAVEKMPLVSERWKQLSKQLLSFKTQSFNKKTVENTTPA